MLCAPIPHMHTAQIAVHMSMVYTVGWMYTSVQITALQDYDTAKLDTGMGAERGGGVTRGGLICRILGYLPLIM